MQENFPEVYCLTREKFCAIPARNCLMFVKRAITCRQNSKVLAKFWPVCNSSSFLQRLGNCECSSTGVLFALLHNMHVLD